MEFFKTAVAVVHAVMEFIKTAVAVVHAVMDFIKTEGRLALGLKLSTQPRWHTVTALLSPNLKLHYFCNFIYTEVSRSI